MPILALAAEAEGVNRETANTWVQLGKRGHPEFEAWTEEALAIRADWILTQALKMTTTTRDQSEAAKHVSWLLGRIDRDIFDPPKKEPEAPKETKPTVPQKQNVQPPDPETVDKALEKLSSPLHPN